MRPKKPEKDKPKLPAIQQPSIEQEILRIVKSIRAHQEIDSANIHLIIRKVDNVELRLIKIESQLDEIQIQVDEILDILSPVAVSGTVTFGGKMDITVHISDVPQTASAHEWTGPNGTGIEVKPVGEISWASDNPAAVTVNPTSGLLAYVAAGVANISFADAGNAITGSGSVTVVADVAVSGTVTFA